MIGKKICAVFLVSSTTVSLLLSSCSQPSTKRLETPSSAEDGESGEGDAKQKSKATPSKKKPDTPQVTSITDCNPATDSSSGVLAPSADSGTTVTGAANLKLALAGGTGQQLGAPPAVPDGSAQDGNCVSTAGQPLPTTPQQTLPAPDTPPATTPQPPPPAVVPPTVIPPATNPLTSVGGKTLEQCQAEKKSWLPGIGGPSTCGDPLVSWCCSRADVVKQFPTLGSQLDTAIANNEAQGLKLYHCSFAAGKYTLLFLKSDSSGLRTASLNLTGASEKTPNAPACPLPTSATLGF